MAGATLSELSSQFQALTDPANRSTTSNLLTGGISALVANAITGGMLMLKKLLPDKLD